MRAARVASDIWYEQARVMKLQVDRTGWTWPIMGVVGTGLAIGGALTWLYGNRTVTAAGGIAFVCGAPLGLLGMAAWMHGYPYVLADVPGGVIHFVTSGSERVTVRFAELELAIRRRELQLRRLREVHELVSPQLPERVLFTSSSRALVEERQALLEELAAQSAVRAVLATAGAVADGAFREAPALDMRVRELVPDPQRLRAALAALAADRDQEIAAKARRLGAAR